MPGTQPPSAARIVITQLDDFHAVTPEEPAFAAEGGCVPAICLTN